MKNHDGAVSAKPGEWSWLENYNPVWNSPSSNSSESMPCGGGDIGVNIWVEKGDLLFYFCRSGNFDENGSLLKYGRVRLRLNPNLFLNPDSFRQELHLKNGEVMIQAAKGGSRVEIGMWVDVFRPVIHMQVDANFLFSGEVVFESWRAEDRLLADLEKCQCNSYNGYPETVFTRRDTITWSEDFGGILFFHRNRDQDLVFNKILQQQNLGDGAAFWNPQKNLTFGGLLCAEGMTFAGETEGVYCNTAYRGWKMRNQVQTSSLKWTLVLHNEQAESLDKWKDALRDAVTANERAAATAREDTQEWWKAFWLRSHICIQPEQNDKDSEPWQVGRNYQLARYLLGCNAKGVLAQKFNGGLFTFDPVWINPDWPFTPDFRLWGGSVYTAQNQRLLFWPMLKSGDFELPIQEFERYRKSLPAAEHRTRVYWGHDGASFTEQIEIFGLPAAAMWGFESSKNNLRVRPADLEQGALASPWVRRYFVTQLEFCHMILEWRRFTGSDIEEYLPLIRSCLRFYSEHFSRHEKILHIAPSQSIEMYFDATDPTPDIAALQAVLNALVNLPEIPPKDREDWRALLESVPKLPVEMRQNIQVLAPAATYDPEQRNYEIPELYPVFPYNLIGMGLPSLDLGRATWERGASQNQRAFTECWSQVAIFAARLGLVAEASHLIKEKLRNSPRRFSAFWGPGPDHVPDIDHAGSGMIALQEMLLQTPGDKILLFPAWPADWDVEFKLHAPGQTVVSASLKNGVITRLSVDPPSRNADIIPCLPLALQEDSK